MCGAHVGEFDYFLLARLITLSLAISLFSRELQHVKFITFDTLNRYIPSLCANASLFCEIWHCLSLRVVTS